MATTLYSFADVIATFDHPALGILPMNGQGLGDIAISYLNDNTAHDLAADGSVMVSKIKADNASISMSMQQTSYAHRWLTQLFNVINNSPTVSWAAAVFTINTPTGEVITAYGVAPQKRPDQPYKQQGDQVTWNFLAANCTRFA